MSGTGIYTVREIQEILGVSRPTVYSLLKRNEFRWFMVGNKYVVAKTSFDSWLDGSKNNANLTVT